MLSFRQLMLLISATERLFQTRFTSIAQKQRNWLFEVLKAGVLVKCPRLVEKPSRFALTNPPEFGSCAPRDRD